MKKILIITLEYPPQIGGIATYINDLASTLDSNKTIVLAPKMKNTEDSKERRMYSVIRKKLLYAKFFWPRWIPLIWHTWRIVKKENVELILVHHVLPVGYVAMLIKKFLGIPFLIFSHGTDLVAGTQSAWKKSMIARVGEASEQIIFNSESLKHRFLISLPKFKDKSLVLYPCPASSFLEEPSNDLLEKLRNMYALDGKKIILTVSRFVDGKGFPHLLRMIPEILKEIPHLVWILIGDGPKREYIMDTIQKNNFQNIVRYVGELPHDELREFYYLADLFVLLTHPDEGREEGLGLVFLEAAATGLPVVAGKSGGVEEAVLNSNTGILLDIYKGDRAVISSIVDILRNKEFANTLGKNARERIMKDFVWEKQIRLLEPWLHKDSTYDEQKINFIR